MDGPTWWRDPYASLRYLIPGFLFLAFAAAFFPRTLDIATRTVQVSIGRSEIVLFMWLLWSLAIGLVFHAFFQPLYRIVLEPHPRREEFARRAFEMALPGVPPPPPATLRALYAVAFHEALPPTLAARAERERHAIEAGYAALFALALTGVFLLLREPQSALVSTNYTEAQGVAFVIAAGGLGFFLWRRDAGLHAAAAAAVPWESEGVGKRMREAWGRMHYPAGTPTAFRAAINEPPTRPS